MTRPFTLTFANGRTALAIELPGVEDMPSGLRAMGFDRPYPVLVLVGGAGGLAGSEYDRLRPLFEQVLAPVAAATGACVLDGGTDTGIMRMIGQARARANAAGEFPLIGVAATGTVVLPGVEASTSDAAQLEPHHTHFVLVPGARWGDESPWLARVASVLSAGAPSVTVLVNGGDIAQDDVEQSVGAARPVIAVVNTGRAANALVAALRGRASDPRSKELAESGLVRAIRATGRAGTLSRILTGILSGKE